MPIRAKELRLDDLLDIRSAELVLIQDAWVGYGPASPVAARYTLRRSEGGRLSGEGVLSTRLTIAVSVSAAVAKTFLDALAKAPLVPGAYAAHRPDTDDYPRVEVVVQVPTRDVGDRSGIALLFTESQGDLHAPWAVFVGGAAYVANGPEFGRALRMLDRPLAKAKLRRLAGIGRMR